ncbi:T9SS C-terminal target domain-containing protein [candidate division KSB1 bacterium]|nr:MAG: T9SS C-terminal target domain-containing protein [candidate division KSB1 bacterium]
MKYLQILIALLVAVPVYAQISVTSSSLKSWLGFKQVLQADTTGAVSVNVGVAGENQLWDFSSVSTQGYTTTYEFFTAANTPHASLYPNANYAYKIQALSNIGEGTLYQYVNLADDKFQLLGGVLVLDGEIVFSSEENDVTPLPITYGNAWESSSADTMDLGGVGKMITRSSEKITVDGWGTIKLPSGSYPCLRWRSEGKLEQVTRVGDIEVPISSSTYIDYTWIGENSFLLASVSSVEDETNPNFSIAAEVMWLQEVMPATKVHAADEELLLGFELAQNYPNPFNPVTTFSFQLPMADFVTLSIHDVSGRMVRQLAAQYLPAGVHRYRWDGTDDAGLSVAAGAYLYKLSTSSFADVQKMTLLK